MLHFVKLTKIVSRFLSGPRGINCCNVKSLHLKERNVHTLSKIKFGKMVVPTKSPNDKKDYR